MTDTGFEKSQVFDAVKSLEYIDNSVVIKTIYKKTTGDISVVAFDSGQSLTGKISPYDNFIQVIDGTAEIIIEGNSLVLGSGQSVIIPAHTHNTINASPRLKMISTIIKSGYEEFE